MVSIPKPVGARLSIQQATTEPELAAVTGRYFSGRAMVSSSTESRDLGKAADLGKTSMALSV